MLVHWNKSPQIDVSAHADTLYLCRANQSLLFLLNATCLVEKQQIPILQSLVEWLLLSANSALFQLYHGENKLIFNKMMMKSALY
jgi:hypothetical protein